MHTSRLTTIAITLGDPAGIGPEVAVKALGLPIVRTPVNHGTALDIAGRNLASATDTKAAMRLAVRMSTMARPSD